MWGVSASARATRHRCRSRQPLAHLSLRLPGIGRVRISARPPAGSRNAVLAPGSSSRRREQAWIIFSPGALTRPGDYPESRCADRHRCRSAGTGLRLAGAVHRGGRQGSQGLARGGPAAAPTTAGARLGNTPSIDDAIRPAQALRPASAHPRLQPRRPCIVGGLPAPIERSRPGGHPARYLESARAMAATSLKATTDAAARGHRGRRHQSLRVGAARRDLRRAGGMARRRQSLRHLGSTHWRACVSRPRSRNQAQRPPVRRTHCAASARRWLRQGLPPAATDRLLRGSGRMLRAMYIAAVSAASLHREDQRPPQQDDADQHAQQQQTWSVMRQDKLARGSR